MTEIIKENLILLLITKFNLEEHAWNLNYLFPPLSTELEGEDELAAKRITRILTTDLPQYFAVVSRVRIENQLIGEDGGVISSKVVPQVQAVFPKGALNKKIRVGLQVRGQFNGPFCKCQSLSFITEHGQF